jgi:ferrous-iron efflux pump FieF
MSDLENIPDIKPQYALIASGSAIVTVATLIVIKSYAFWQSGSAAVLATLTDSLTDAAISLMMFLAVRYSLRPADKSHRHGHGKMEGIASMFQGAFMGGAAVFLFFEGLRRLAEPKIVTEHLIGIIVAVVSIVLTFLLVQIQNYCLRYAPSLAVSADRAHYTTDIALNGSVILALIIGHLGGPAWVDTACAFLVAGYFGWTARKIALEATAGIFRHPR